MCAWHVKGSSQTLAELVGLGADRVDLITEMSKEKPYSSLFEAKASLEFLRKSFCQETNGEKYSRGLETSVAKNIFTRFCLFFFFNIFIGI